MAMAAIAPQNDWGTIGTWPGGRVIGIRATTNNELFLRMAAYDRALLLCTKATQHFAIAAVVWSLNCSPCQPTATDSLYLEDSIVSAHQRGISVVASSGNVPGSGNQFPADQPGVFSVAAGAHSGALCSESSFDGGVDVLGPGCPVYTADPLTGAPQQFQDGGSSTAAAVTATSMAALRSLRPDASFEQVEHWIRTTVHEVDGRPVLDGAAAARLAGLGDVVDRAHARMPAAATPAQFHAEQALAPSTTPAPASAQIGLGLRRLHKPVDPHVRWKKGVLRVSVTDRPTNALLQVSSWLRKGRRNRTVTRDTNRVMMRLGASPRHVTLRYVPSFDSYNQASPTLRLKRRRNGAFM